MGRRRRRQLLPHQQVQETFDHVLEKAVGHDTSSQCLAIRKDLAVCFPVPKGVTDAFIPRSEIETVIPGAECFTVFSNSSDSAKIEMCAPSKLDAQLLSQDFAMQMTTVFDRMNTRR